MKALVLLSGGIDSTTCLALAMKKYDGNAVALSVYYGQKHKKEMIAAKAVAEHYGIKHIVLDLKPIFENSNCSLLQWSDQAVPEEDYASQIKENNGNPVNTYVPFRNGLFLSVAASIAYSEGCDTIMYGAHADDAAGNAYPDCSKEFTDAIGEAIFSGTGEKVSVFAPFVGHNKAEVVKIGLKLNAPYELTWSCYNGGDKPCGKCGTCIDRAKAFEANGVKDPAMR